MSTLKRWPIDPDPELRRPLVNHQYFALKSCASKRQHVTLAQAQAEADRLNKSRYAKLKLPYKCMYCHLFHVGGDRTMDKKVA